MVTGDQISFCNEAAVAYFKLMPRHSPAEREGNHGYHAAIRWNTYEIRKG
jgi:hypothetical protein